MTFLDAVPPALLVLPALSMAAGLDLYLTLLLLGLSPHTGLWDGTLPGDLGDLDSLGVHLVAGGFYAAELLAERWPLSALVWNGFHAVIRPLAGVLLALLLLEGQPTPVVLGGAAAAAVIASLAHAVRAGGHILLWLRRALHPRRGLLSVAEDVLVVGLVTLALDRPLLAASVTLGIAGVALVRSPSDIRAFAFAVELGAGWVFGSLRQARWRSRDEFPSWLAAALQQDVERLPGVGVKGCPAGAAGLRNAPRFVRGWLVSFGGSPSFVHPGRRGARRIALDATGDVRVADQALFRRVELAQEDDAQPAVLCVGRSGPSAEGLANEFR